MVAQVRGEHGHRGSGGQLNVLVVDAVTNIGNGHVEAGLYLVGAIHPGSQGNAAGFKGVDFDVGVVGVPLGGNQRGSLASGVDQASPEQVVLHLSGLFWTAHRPQEGGWGGHSGNASDQHRQQVVQRGQQVAGSVAQELVAGGIKHGQERVEGHDGYGLGRILPDSADTAQEALAGLFYLGFQRQGFLLIMIGAHKLSILSFGRFYGC